MSRGENVFYTFVGLIAAFYSMAAMIGSDPSQTRWALMFVISTIIFYELSVNRQLEIKEQKIKPGGCCVPAWVRYFTLVMTVAALAAMFWVSVGRYDGKTVHPRLNLQSLENIIHNE